MVDLSGETLLDAALRMQLLSRSVEITFGAGETLSFRFPNTRKIADFLGVPHYLVLRSFALLERDQLVTRAERVGIISSPAGSRIMAGILQEKYHAEAESILGAEIFAAVIQKSRFSSTGVLSPEEK